jgi:hypothetical protein
LPLARWSRLGESGKALEQFFLPVVLPATSGGGVETAKAQRQRRQPPY